MDSCAGSALQSTACASALLRETLISWREIMLPHFQNSAIAEWGDEWQRRLLRDSLLSSGMKEQISSGAGWDCYRIAKIFLEYPKTFWPSYETMVDIVREIYRSAVTHAKHGINQTHYSLWLRPPSLQGSITPLEISPRQGLAFSHTVSRRVPCRCLGN